MPDHPRLLAMTGAGDIVFAKDQAGRIWLIEALNEDGPRQVEPEAVDEAMARHQLLRVDRSFDSWAALDDFRLEEAQEFLARFEPPDHELTVDDVRRALRQIARWITNGERSIARDLALHLLSVDTVRLEKPLHQEVISALNAATAPLDVSWLREPAPSDERTIRATARLQNRWEPEAA